MVGAAVPFLEVENTLSSFDGGDDLTLGFVGFELPVK